MTEKLCWQLQVTEPTPCFKKAGNLPCTTEGCTVQDRILELEQRGIFVDESFLELLLHSECRISSLAGGINDEYWQRINNN